MSIFVFLKLIGSLALLMYGMKTMSEALQKLTGGHLRHILGAMTTNRFTGLLTGTFVTASVQSSTATTVMTVSFVNAGLLTLGQMCIRDSHHVSAVRAGNVDSTEYLRFSPGLVCLMILRRRMARGYLLRVRVRYRH